MSGHPVHNVQGLLHSRRGHIWCAYARIRLRFAQQLTVQRCSLLNRWDTTKVKSLHLLVHFLILRLIRELTPRWGDEPGPGLPQGDQDLSLLSAGDEGEQEGLGEGDLCRFSDTRGTQISSASFFWLSDREAKVWVMVSKDWTTSGWGAGGVAGVGSRNAATRAAISKTGGCATCGWVGS